MIDPKTLKKLAATCRKAGIKEYNCAEFSFKLTDDVPEKTVKRSKTKSSTSFSNAPMSQDKVLDDAALSDEALLMWSVSGSDITSEN